MQMYFWRYRDDIPEFYYYVEDGSVKNTYYYVNDTLQSSDIKAIKGPIIKNRYEQKASK
jgi:hypothetical protein